MSRPIDDLRSLLDEMTGNVQPTAKLINALAVCWDGFDGSRAESMESWKLRSLEES